MMEETISCNEKFELILSHYKDCLLHYNSPIKDLNDAIKKSTEGFLDLVNWITNYSQNGLDLNLDLSKNKSIKRVRLNVGRDINNGKES